MNVSSKAILDIAYKQKGIKEFPRGSNNVKYNTWYYGRQVSGNYPWCMVFVQWVFNEAGIAPIKRTASCTTLMQAAKKAGQWVEGQYMPGDIIIYKWAGSKNKADHTGILLKFNNPYVTCIEGNTSVSNASNGGEVCVMKRHISSVVGAWRPPYKEEEMSQDEFNKLMTAYLEELSEKEPSSWSKEAREWAESNGIIKGNGKNIAYKSLITREEAVMLISRLFDLLGK